MTRPGLIERGWLSYAGHVLPKNAPAVQVKETRRAFYAGAALLWESFIAALGPGGEADPPDLALAEGVQREIDQFVSDVARGRR